MPASVPTVPQAARLTESQIAEFKRTGYLVLPGVVDADLCRQARDQMWETIAESRPSMKRDDPSPPGSRSPTRRKRATRVRRSAAIPTSPAAGIG